MYLFDLVFEFILNASFRGLFSILGVLVVCQFLRVRIAPK